MYALLEPFLAWMESSVLAKTISESSLLTASLSAVHLLGAALIGGAAVVSGLRLGGALFADRPLVEIVRPAGRAILLGLLISVTTGALQFTPRALTAAGNDYFQLKLLMLVSAAACYLVLYRRVVGTRQPGGSSRTWTGVFGVLASMLWIGVVAAGSAFILLE